MKKNLIKREETFTTISGDKRMGDILQAFGRETLTTVVQSFALAIAKIQDQNSEYYIYGTISELKRDASIKAGAIIRTAGYHRIGDGGAAEFVIKSLGQAESDSIKISNNLYASLISYKNDKYQIFRDPGN